MTIELQEWFASEGIIPENTTIRYTNDDTALHIAARKGNVSAVTWLLQQGADTEAQNKDGNPPLWHACFAGNEEIIRILANANANLNHVNDNHTTALMYCSSSGRDALVSLLLELGADKTISNLDGFTALDHASTFKILTLLR